MRGLPMDFPADRGTHGVADQFLFGPALMVSPVTEYQLHRPPEPSVLVPTASFRTPDGKPGLLARYYKDTAYKTLGLERVDPTVDVFWYTGRPDYVTDSTLSIRWEGQLVPSAVGPAPVPHQGVRHQAGRPRRTGAALRRAGQRAVHRDRDARGRARLPPQGRAGERHLGRSAHAAPLEDARDLRAREGRRKPVRRHAPCTCPRARAWTDFWTGASHPGGRTIVADAPIETLPLLVRAGSIVPLGPELQYATEKPADPIELRVYPGADGRFTLYEDENDGYAYEKGVHATIGLRWDDARRQLTLEERQGQFPGMLKSRTFQVVLVREGHGTGGEADRGRRPRRHVRRDAAGGVVLGIVPCRRAWGSLRAASVHSRAGIGEGGPDVLDRQVRVRVQDVVLRRHPRRASSG